MRFGGVFQRELELGPQPQLAGGNPAEEIARALLKLLARRDVVGQRGPRQKERAFLAEQLGIEWRDGAARLSEEHQHAARRQAVQALGERRLADRIVDDLNPFAAGDLLDRFLEILAGVEDDVIGACVAREPRLLVGRNRRDDARAAQLRDLRQQQADAAGARVNQARVARP